MFHKFGVTLTSYHSCAYVQVIEHGESKLALEGQRQNGGTETDGETRLVEHALKAEVNDSFHHPRLVEYRYFRCSSTSRACKVQQAFGLVFAG